MFSLAFRPLAAPFFHYFELEMLLKFPLNWQCDVYYTCIVYSAKHRIVLWKQIPKYEDGQVGGNSGTQWEIYIFSSKSEGY
jgi:hypothetical protein